MKAIEVKKGDTVLFEGEKVKVSCLFRNGVLIEVKGKDILVSYSQIKNYEPE